MKNLRSIVSALALTCLAFISNAQKAADYAGEYTMSENPYVKVLKLAEKDGKLIMSAEGFPDTELTAGTKADAFVLGGMGGEISFTRVAGAVTKLKIEAQGQTLEGVKAGAAVVASAGVSEYAATFKMADNEYVKKMTVTSKDGKLLMSSDTNPSEGAVLTPASTPDTFATTIQGYEAEITFGRAAGKVQTIKLSVAGGAVVLNGTVE
jgi:alkanesulfonate monooxygenase SsuD/methylene tetrahydromethanopterin reductase-like flavin-dependent oxidoreductase (luciferase family)